MSPIPFSESEMAPIGEQPGFPGAPSRTLWNSPLTLRENYLLALAHEPCAFLPNALDVKPLNTRLIPDNRARAEVTVLEGEQPFVPNPAGEPDVFGVQWLFDPQIHGSMVRPGNPMLSDANDWRDVLRFPNPDEWDWASEAKRYAGYLSDQRFVYQSTIFTGYFERLISLMDFENAAVAMIDEDQQDAVSQLFDALDRLYLCYIDHFIDDFGVQLVEVHDDWGSQASTFVSTDTLRTMVIPHLRRLADHVHARGAFLKLHSCGKIERFVPLMVEAGVDEWMGQAINAKQPLVQEHGDKILVEVEAPELGEGASDQQVWQAAREFADVYLQPGTQCVLSIYSAGLANRPLMTEALYRLSRERYGKTT